MAGAAEGAGAEAVERAHGLYRGGRHREALELYSAALAAARGPAQRIALHSNRAACYLKLHDFHKVPLPAPSALGGFGLLSCTDCVVAFGPHLASVVTSGKGRSFGASKLSCSGFRGSCDFGLVDCVFCSSPNACSI
jgi:hypothetical protein